jgi:hypothetical protein
VRYFSHSWPTVTRFAACRCRYFARSHRNRRRAGPRSERDITLYRQERSDSRVACQRKRRMALVTKTGHLTDKAA